MAKPGVPEAADPEFPKLKLDKRTFDVCQEEQPFTKGEYPWSAIRCWYALTLSVITASL